MKNNIKNIRNNSHEMVLCYLSPPALSCDANSSYTTCMSPCPASCADLAAPSECDTTSCVEGCQCAAGFVMSEGICVPYTQCGCTFLNRYYTVRGLMEL